MPGRPRHGRPQRERIFIGCEGASEYNYCTFLSRLLERYSDERHLDAYDCRGGDHLAVVRSSIEEMRRRTRLRGRYVRKAILLDSDLRERDHVRDAECDELIAANKIDVLWQRPTFEGFLVMHFRGQRRRHSTAAGAHGRLMKLWPDYAKPVTSYELEAKIGIEGVKIARTAHLEFDDFLRVIGFPD